MMKEHSLCAAQRLITLICGAKTKINVPKTNCYCLIKALKGFKYVPARQHASCSYGAETSSHQAWNRGIP